MQVQFYSDVLAPLLSSDSDVVLKKVVYLQVQVILF